MIPVWYILVPFAAVVAFAGLFLFFNLFHILRFSIASRATYAILSIYVGGFLIILGISAAFMSRYDWTVEFDPMAALHLNAPANNSIYGL